MMKVRIGDLRATLESIVESDKCKGKNPGLWCNIHKRRKAGKRPKRPGQEGYPKTLDIDEVDGLDESDGEWYGLGRGPGRPGVLDRSKKRRMKRSTPYPTVAAAWSRMSPTERDDLVVRAMTRQVGMHPDEAATYAGEGHNDNFADVIEPLGPDAMRAMESELR
jgi:hypothetical protein